MPTVEQEMLELANELRFHAKMQCIPEGTTAIMLRAADIIHQAAAPQGQEAIAPVAWQIIAPDGSPSSVTREEMLMKAWAENGCSFRPLYAAYPTVLTLGIRSDGGTLREALAEYARDLRRNSSGGDDYPWEIMRGVADYLDVLMQRYPAVAPTLAQEPREATLAKALQDVRQELWVDYCLGMGRTDTDPHPFDSKPHIRIIDATLAQEPREARELTATEERLVSKALLDSGTLIDSAPPPQVDLAREEIARVLEWYASEAEAAARYMTQGKTTTADALLAILIVLANDGGKRARTALAQAQEPGKKAKDDTFDIETEQREGWAYD